MRWVEYTGTDGFKIDITEKTVKQIVEELLNQSERPTEELTKEADQVLKQAAHQFLAVVEYEKQHVAKLENLLQEKKK